MFRSRRHVRPLVLGAALYAFGAMVPHAYAQIATAITSDGTLGTTVAQSGNLYDINGGTIKGNNQFHSFGQFSVGTGDIASFNGPSTIQNILSRVTGGTRSEIDGTLRSTISGANLFLLNPSGILFGPNAQLDVSGSFHATTADYIGLADGARFNALPSSADNLLTTAPPAAFGFLISNPAPIDVQTFAFDDVSGLKTLQVPAGKTLSLVGGPINLDAAPGAEAGGFLFAPGGRINLVSVASPGEAKFDGTGFSVDTFAQLGDISIKGNSVVDGKEVFIRGGRLVIEQGTINPGFVFLSGAPVDPPDGGEVNIEVSDSVTIKGPATAFGLPSGIVTFAGLPFLRGDVPNISIKASAISLSEGGVVLTQRQGPGQPGNISIQADTVEVRSGASIAAINEFEGPGGTLTVNARNVTLDSEGDQLTGLSAQARFHGDYGFDFSPSLQLADSGSITVNATSTLTMRGSAQISTDNFAFGRSGNVTVNAGDMLMVGAGPNTGLISSQSALAGRAGDVTINASGSIDMQNGFRISANTLGSDDAGQVSVRAGRSLTMTGNSTFISGVTGQPVDVELDSFAQLFAPFFGVEILDYSSLRAALGVAPSPNDLMNVLAALRTISDGAGNPLVAVTDFTPGNGGKVSVTVPVLAVNNGAHIETSTVWDGNAGAIALDVGSLTLRDGAIIGSRSGAVRPDRGFTVGTGNAGTVEIAATGTVEISGRSPTSGEGSIVTTNTFGDGNAGNISLSASQVNVQNGGIVASASGGIVDGQLFVGAGNAGQINVSTPTLTMADGTISVATSGVGSAGSILLNGNTLSLTGGSRVVSSTTGAGQGGSVAATAGESIFISGSGSGLLSTASSSGNAGQITVSTPTLTMGDSGTISVATSGAGNAGNILLNVSSFAQTGGAQVVSSTTGDGVGGTVAVTASELVSISGAGSGLFSTASSTGNAGQITVSAPALAPVPTLTMADGGTISVATSGAGSAGSILLNANNLSLTGGAQVVSSTTGTGQGGSVTANAGESISISGGGSLPSGLFSTASSTGNAGQITVSTPTLTMGESGTISVATEGSGNAGNITLNVGNLTQTGGAQVVSSTTGAGAGGNLTVTATNSIFVSGSGSQSSGLFSTASSTGNAGEVTVSTQTLTMGDGGTISVATSGAGNAGNVLMNVSNFSLTGGAQIVSSTSGAGQGGSVTANATDSGSISGQGTGMFSTASGTGAGGTINIQADQLQIADSGVISANSTGTATATAGSVNIVAGELVQMQNGSITTESTLADGGNISITTTGSLVRLIDSQITTSVESGVGTGGNITVNSDHIVLDDSQILANAFGGPGGNINITADVFLVNSGGQSPTSLAGIVEASSALSTPGTINIEAAVTDVSGTVAQLPEAPLQATELLRAACAARFVGGKTSSLVLGGRDGLPLQPGSLLPSPPYLASTSDTPSTISSTGFSLPTGFSLLGSSDRLSNRYSLLPNFKCSL